LSQTTLDTHWRVRTYPTSDVTFETHTGTASRCFNQSLNQ
jgi:hypothetical protein